METPERLLLVLSVSHLGASRRFQFNQKYGKFRRQMQARLPAGFSGNEPALTPVFLGRHADPRELRKSSLEHMLRGEGGGEGSKIWKLLSHDTWYVFLQSEDVFELGDVTNPVEKLVRVVCHAWRQFSVLVSVCGAAYSIKKQGMYVLILRKRCFFLTLWGRQSRIAMWTDFMLKF